MFKNNKSENGKIDGIFTCVHTNTEDLRNDFINTSKRWICMHKM